MSDKTDVWNTLIDPYYLAKQNIRAIADAFEGICNVKLAEAEDGTTMCVTINHTTFFFEYVWDEWRVDQFSETRLMFLNSISYRLKSHDKWPLDKEATKAWKEKACQQ